MTPQSIVWGGRTARQHSCVLPSPDYQARALRGRGCPCHRFKSSIAKTMIFAKPQILSPLGILSAF
ncbi:MAG: hypothetical protein WBA89_24475 [Microcoleus sp.]